MTNVFSAFAASLLVPALALDNRFLQHGNAGSRMNDRKPRVAVCKTILRHRSNYSGALAAELVMVFFLGTMRVMPLDLLDQAVDLFKMQITHFSLHVRGFRLQNFEHFEKHSAKTVISGVVSFASLLFMVGVIASAAVA
jgi:hypothetical protein